MFWPLQREWRLITAKVSTRLASRVILRPIATTKCLGERICVFLYRSYRFHRYGSRSRTDRRWSSGARPLARMRRLSLCRGGAGVHHGSLEDLESLRSGAGPLTGDPHRFIHDFSTTGCREADRRAETLGGELAGSDARWSSLPGPCSPNAKARSHRRDAPNPNFPGSRRNVLALAARESAHLYYGFPIGPRQWDHGLAASDQHRT
jgi:hypothetical protein